MIRKVNETLMDFGINLRRIINSLGGIPKFISDLKKFDKGDWKLNFTTSLSDYKESAGNIKGHYFHQDLLIAQKIFKNNPKNHLDIGSSVSGFVSHVATFRKIDLIDIRELDSKVKNINFIHGDLMEDLNLKEKYDSVSSLHVLEHMGLGRYGDKVMKDGYKVAIKNLINITSEGGVIYVSVPISNNQRIEFNSYRVFNIKTFLKEFEDLKLISFSYVDDEGDLHKDVKINGEIDCNYGCGIFEFRKEVELNLKERGTNK